MPLSNNELASDERWENLRLAQQRRETVTGRVVERVKGGLKVEVDGILAFLPGSQIEITLVQDFESYVGDEIQIRVIKINRKRRNVIMSRKAVLENS